MSLRFSTILAAVLVCGSAHAQISITSSTLYPYPPGEPVRFENVATSGGNVPADDQARIDALIGRTGAGQTWDFSTITYPERADTEITLFTNLSSVPGSGRFPSATVALGMAFAGAPPGPGSTSYTYGTLTDAAFTAVGFFLPSSTGGADFAETYDAGGLVRFRFPFTAGSAVSDETTVAQTSASGSQTYTLSESRTVLGYGTLTTPEGSAPCLMFRQVETRAAPDGTVLSTVTRYMWETLSTISAMASNEELAPGVRNYTAFHTIRRSGPVASEAGTPEATLRVSVGPSPTQGAATVRLTAVAPLDASVAVFDRLGREVARLHDGSLSAGPHAFAIDTARLAPGVYVVRADVAGQAISAPLVVVR